MTSGAATYIVPVWVLDESESVVRDLVDKLDALGLRCVVNAALQDAATVTVGRNLNAVGSDSIVDELMRD